MNKEVFIDLDALENKKRNIILLDEEDD